MIKKNIGLANKFIQIFSYAEMGKTEWSLWPIQK